MQLIDQIQDVPKTSAILSHYVHLECHSKSIPQFHRQGPMLLFVYQMHKSQVAYHKNRMKCHGQHRIVVKIS
jgi:hypothetical protein